MYDAGVESLPLVRLFVGPLLLVGLTTLGAVLARPGRIVLPLVCSVSGGLAVFLLPSPVPLFAEVLGLPGGTVRSRINRARGMLQHKLQPLIDQQDAP